MNMKKTIRKQLGSLLFSLFLLTVTLFLLLRNGEAERLLPALEAADPAPLAAGFCSMLLFISCEAFAIMVLLRSFSYRASFLKCLKYSFIGFYFCSITPGASGGQPAQVYYMSRDGYDPGPSALSILIVTASYQADILLAGILTLVFRWELVTLQLGAVRYFVLFGACINLLLLALLTGAAFRPRKVRGLLASCIRLLGRVKWIKDPDRTLRDAENQMEEYRKGAEHLRKNPRILFTVLFAILLQIFSRLSVTYAVYRAFGLRGYSWLDIVALQAMLALAVESIPLPGAVGAAEAGFLAVNRAVFGADRLVPAMLLSRGTSFYVMVPLSLCLVLAAQLSGRRAEKPDAKTGGKSL